MDSSVREQAAAWLAHANLTQASAARRAGLSQSTLHRVLSGSVDPTAGTLHEIAFACGLQLELTTSPASDPAAAAAARLMLENDFNTDDPETTRWSDRLVRLAGGTDPVELTKTAAKMSAPLLRHDAALFIGPTLLGRLASAGDASRSAWALSGEAGLTLPGFSEPLPNRSILWTADIAALRHNLADSALTQTHRPDRATLAVIPAGPELFINSFEVERIVYAAPLQIMIDCLSLGGSTAEKALAQVMSW